MPVKKANLAAPAAAANVVATPAAAVPDKKVEDKYKKYELLEHILALPDTYIGSIEPQKITSYIYDEPTKKMITEELTYIPGLLKIFDEVIVNAIDHSMRLKADEAKNLKINKISLNEKSFRWMMNEDEIGNEKLADGIRLFAKDAVKLEEMIKEKLKIL